MYREREIEFVLNPNRLRYHDRTAFVHGRLNFYDSNKIKQTMRAQMMKRQQIQSHRKQQAQYVSVYTQKITNKLKNESLKCSIECKTGQYKLSIGWVFCFWLILWIGILINARLYDCYYCYYWLIEKYAPWFEQKCAFHTKMCRGKGSVQNCRSRTASSSIIIYQWALASHR